MIWPWGTQYFWNALATSQKSRFPNEEAWIPELSKTRFKTVRFPRSNCCFGWESQRKHQFDLWKCKVFETRFRHLEKQSFPMRKLESLSCQKRVSKRYVSQGQIPALMGISKRHWFDLVKYCVFATRSRHFKKPSFPMRELALLSCRKRVSKTLRFPWSNIYIDKNHKETMIWPLAIQCFWNAFPTSQRTSFTMRKLDFRSCRERVSKTLRFPRSNCCFWWESRKHWFDLGNVFGTRFRHREKTTLPNEET